MLDANQPYHLSEKSFDAFLATIGDFSKGQLQLVQSGGSLSLKKVAKQSWLGRFFSYFYKDPSKRAASVAEMTAKLLERNCPYLKTKESLQAWSLRKERLIQTACRFKKHARLQQVVREIIASCDQRFEEQRLANVEAFSKAAKKEEKAYIRGIILDTKRQIELLRQEIRSLEEALSKEGIPNTLSNIGEEGGSEEARKSQLQLESQLLQLQSLLLETKSNLKDITQRKAKEDFNLMQKQGNLARLKNHIKSEKEKILSLQKDVQRLEAKIEQFEEKFRQQALKQQEIEKIRVFQDPNALERLRTSQFLPNARIQGSDGAVGSHTSLLNRGSFFNNFYRSQQKKEGLQVEGRDITEGLQIFDLSEFTQETIQRYHAYSLGEVLPALGRDIELLKLAEYIGDVTLYEELEKALLPGLTLEEALYFVEEALDFVEDPRFPSFQAKAWQMIGLHLNEIIEKKLPFNKGMMALLLKEHYISCKSQLGLLDMLYRFAAQQLGEEKPSSIQVVSWLDTPISNQEKTTWLDFIDFSAIITGFNLQRMLKGEKESEHAISYLRHRYISGSAEQKAVRLFHFQEWQYNPYNLTCNLYLSKALPLGKNAPEFLLSHIWAGRLIHFVIKPFEDDRLGLFLKNENLCFLQNKDKTRISLSIKDARGTKNHGSITLSQAEALGEDAVLASWPRAQGLPDQEGFLKFEVTLNFSLNR
jgi:hypothetical protein